MRSHGEVVCLSEPVAERQVQRAPSAESPTPDPEGRGEKRNVLKRVITGLSLSFLTIFLIVIHPHAFAFEVMFFVSLGIKEMCDLAEKNGIRASYPVALPCGMAIVWAASWSPQLMSPMLAACVVATMVCMTFRTSPQSSPSALVRSTRYLDGIVTMYAFMYVGWLFSFCLQIRLMPGKVPVLGGASMDAGAAYLLMLITTTAFSDVGAYAFGKLFGRHLLAPDISPGKTVEGSLGGMLTSMLVAMLFGWWLGLTPVACAAYGVIVSLVAQLGDLWESMMKREAGIKDSGRALAGHGGVLDRFDSFFYAMPVGYLLTTYLLL